MTDYQRYINALRKCAKEHENDRTSTGHIIISDLCIDTANLLEALEQDTVSKELWKFLNRLKVRMKERDEDNGGEPLNAVDRGYHLAYKHLCEEIDNLLKENKVV